jgi:cytochrome c
MNKNMIFPVNQILSVVLSMVLSMVLSLVLVACGKQNPGTEGSPTATAPTSSEVMPSAAPGAGAETRPDDGTTASSADTTESSSADTATESTNPNNSAAETNTPAAGNPVQENPASAPATESVKSEASGQPGANTVTQQSMLTLARSSGCLTCHSVDKKIVGPAWRDVAKRYQGADNARARLIEKVSKGGRGNWTDVVGNVAMPPYSPRVSNDNIAKLIDFVLSLSPQ